MKKNYLYPSSEVLALEELGTILQTSPSAGSGEQMNDNPEGWGNDFWN